MIETAAAGVALVALHHRRPLPRRHGARAGIGQQVNEHIVRRKQEQIVVSSLQPGFALFAGRPANRLNALDPERLDDGLYGHGIRLSPFLLGGLSLLRDL